MNYLLRYSYLLIYPTYSGALELPRSRFPSSLYLFPGSVKLFGEALVSLMRRFSWRSIVVINDRLFKVAANSRSIQQCQGCLTVLQRNAAEIYQRVINIDSSVPEEEMESALTEARNHSRSKYHLAEFSHV